MFKNISRNRNLLSILLSIIIFGMVYIISYFDFLYTFDKVIQRIVFTNNIDSSDSISKSNCLNKNDLCKDKISSDVVVIEIDDKTLEDGSLGRFPFDRSVYKTIINRLNNLGVEIIGFDIIFTEASNNKSDEEFGNAIKNAGNVIIGSYLKGFNKTIKGNISELKNEYPGGYLNVINKNKGLYLLRGNYFEKSFFNNDILNTGFFSPIIDKKNGVVYGIYPFIKTIKDQIYDNFSITILKEYYKSFYKGNIKIYNNKYDSNFYYLTENKKIPFSRKGGKEILINFINNGKDSHKKFTKFSFIDIYKNKNLDSSVFKNKIVLIGTSAKGIKDVFNTPNGIEPGVYIHANMINTILQNDYNKYFNINLEYLLLFLLIIFSVYFNLSRSGYILLLSNLSIGIIFLLIFPTILAFYSNTILNFPVELLVGLILSLAISNTVKYLIENINKVKLNKALSEYVSVDVAKEILSGEGKINLNGENKNITIFFSDIEGFTSISEKFGPEELVGFLREYLSEMSDIIMDEKGFINKYEGDAIMALWGVFGDDINKTNNICISALKQQEKLKELNKIWSKRGFSEIKARIGMHLGDAIIGNIGSEGRKMEFTALGDSVNLASRLEGVNKFYGTYICASEDIYEKEKENFEFRYLDKIKVKGKEIPVKIYELLGIKGQVSAEQLEIKKLFENAVSLYLNREFRKSRTIFRKLIKMGDNAGKMYLDMCDIYIKNPPGDEWSGVATMTGK